MNLGKGGPTGPGPCRCQSGGGSGAVAAPGSLPGERKFDLTPACQTDSQTSPPSILVPQQLLSVIRYCDSNGLQLHNHRGYAFCMVAALAALDLKQASHWFKVRVPVCPAPPALVRPVRLSSGGGTCRWRLFVADGGRLHLCLSPRLAEMFHLQTSSAQSPTTTAHLSSAQLTQHEMHCTRQFDARHQQRPTNSATRETERIPPPTPCHPPPRAPSPPWCRFGRVAFPEAFAKPNFPSSVVNLPSTGPGPTPRQCCFGGTPPITIISGNHTPL